MVNDLSQIIHELAPTPPWFMTCSLANLFFPHGCLFLFFSLSPSLFRSINPYLFLSITFTLLLFITLSLFLSMTLSLPVDHSFFSSLTLSLYVACWLAPTQFRILNFNRSMRESYALLAVDRNVVLQWYSSNRVANNSGNPIGFLYLEAPKYRKPPTRVYAKALRNAHNQ